MLAFVVAVPLSGACGGHVEGGGGGGGGGNADASADRNVINVCPQTLGETNGNACGTAGLSCSQDFTCDGETQQTICTCESAHFRCQDPIGLLPPGHDPRCLSNDPSKYYCPATMLLANGLTCDLVGQNCYYDGELCPNGLTKLNYCTCTSNDMGGHNFKCAIVPCEPDFGDGGAEDAALD